MTRYNIYVGLDDPITHRQMFDTEKYISILKSVCRSYRVGFSFAVIQGGYIYDNGRMAEEKTLYINFLDQTKETVNEIAKDLCTFFHQESVMITSGEVEMYFVRGDNEVEKIPHPSPNGE